MSDSGIPEELESAGSLPRAFLGVGSNILPEQHILALVRILQATPGIDLLQISTFYRTPALSGPGESNGWRREDSDYLNGVLEIRTSADPEDLLRILEGIEMVLGRVRTTDRYASRTMDLDLLLFLHTPSTTDSQHRGDHPRTPPPHPEIFSRGFVALPLLELAPDLSLPPDHTPLKDVATRFSGVGGEADQTFSALLRAQLPGT